MVSKASKGCFKRVVSENDTPVMTKNPARVATAQGKQGIWFLLFPDRENTGNFVVTQGKFLKHRENIFDYLLMQKACFSLHIFKFF